MTELTTYDEIAAALKRGQFVHCDIAQPTAKGLPVRNVRKFKTLGLDNSRGISTQEWTALAFQGQAKGYEVLVLEGWHVPEKVYVK